MNGFGQQVQPLSVGDTVPDATLNHLINYRTSSVKISDFKGKLLVLDFWDTWCTACINTFPHNHELQQQFEGKIQILNVGFQPENKIKPFLTSLEQRRGASYTITTVTGDTLLQQMFPHNYVPHLVWIGPDGVVKAITAPESLTAANINKVLNGQAADIRQKQDVHISQPLFLPSAITDSPFNMVHYSLLVKGDKYDGAGTSQRYFKEGNSVYGCNYTNRSLDNICMMLGYRVWGEQLGQHFNKKRYKIEISDSETLSQFKKQTWQFSFFLPKNESDSFYYKALEEIGRYTGYTVKVVERMVRCLLLTKTGSTDKLATQGGKPANNLFKTDNSRLINQTMSVLATSLDDATDIFDLPIVEETGYNGNVDIALHAPYTLASIQKQLQNYGLALVNAQRPMAILTVNLKDK